MPRAAVFLVLAAAIGGGVATLRPEPGAKPLPGPARLDPPVAPAPPREGPRYPVPQPPVRPTPPLDQSDAQIVDALAGTVGAEGIRGLLAPSGIVRRFVATVDRLTRADPHGAAYPVRPPGGSLRIEWDGGALRLAPGNALRYESYVRALESAPSRQLVALYTRVYPLLQKAYAEMGFPAAYFNDRLVDVIDHLLQAPEATRPPELVPRRSGYAFAAPDLESRSTGHKLLLRLGARNAARVKAKLREIRALLVLQAAPEPARSSEALAE